MAIESYHPSRIVTIWKNHRKSRKIILFFVLSVAFSLFVAYLLSLFFEFIEARPGVLLNDPLFNIISPIDLSTPIFIVLYLMLFISIYRLCFEPIKFILGLNGYTLIILIRIITLYVTPLDHSPNMIELKDPFLWFFYPGHMITKDLFFSGHTATGFFLYLLLPPGRLKKIFLIATLFVASALIIQQVHYSVDVFAGFAFSYLSYSIITVIERKFLSKK
ncbi:MAG: hypothetical protein HW421_2943 [Ignavibacteria bacterium]|nr:hypothetical protein [Ignavibacteria bacterium]